MSDTYDSLYTCWLKDPENFWPKRLKRFVGIRSGTGCSMTPGRRSINGSPEDGWVNICYNALGRHVESGRADQPARIDDSPVSG